MFTSGGGPQSSSRDKREIGINPARAGCLAASWAITPGSDKSPNPMDSSRAAALDTSFNAISV